jgi:outer membrane receptor protein involved in Fe transport
LHTVFPEANIDIGGDSFVIGSDFRMPTYGAALYHQSNWQVGSWRFTAGLRLDYEYSAMSYFSRATIDYRFDMTMDRYKPLTSEFKGRESQHFFELLPKIAVEYETGVGTLYGTITRGYKAGGFNTQIFSDILQVKMMNDLMEDLGVYLDNVGTTSYDSASATRYKPETSWNFEIGAHLKPVSGLKLDAALFWIECFDQQVTVLPEGNNTGRMMSNAARARSIGAELSATYNYKGLSLALDYGFTDARFRNYNDGTADYAGCYLPYAPKNTISFAAGYTWQFKREHIDSLTLGADMRGVGRIYWNESNALSQPFYALLGAHLTLRMGDVSLTLWGRNLTNQSYDTFYFKSVGKEFFSEGRPIEGGVRININM